MKADGWVGGILLPSPRANANSKYRGGKGVKKAKDLSNKNIGNNLTCKHKYRRELNSVEISDPTALFKKNKK